MQQFAVYASGAIAIIAGYAMHYSRSAIADLSTPERPATYFTLSHSLSSLENLEKRLGPEAKQHIRRYQAALVVLVADAIFFFVFAILMQPDKG